MADARVLGTQVASDKLLITFETDKGEQFQGSIPLHSLETTLIAGDPIVVEYFQTENIGLVKIIGITIKPRHRKVIFECNKRQPPALDSKNFWIKRNENIQSASGYRCLFTDTAADGSIMRTLYLMPDNSLVIRWADGTLKAWVSAREYIETQLVELKAARRYDAIRLLEDQLNRTG